ASQADSRRKAGASKVKPSASSSTAMRSRISSFSRSSSLALASQSGTGLASAFVQGLEQRSRQRLAAAQAGRHQRPGDRAPFFHRLRTQQRGEIEGMDLALVVRIEKK